MTSARTSGWTGLAAAGLFAGALGVFAALDPTYSHLTNAVSELGAVGAPNQLAWNLIGFIAVGLLLAAFGRGLGREIATPSASGLLILFGLAFAATAIPADMSDLGSPGSTAHIVASQAVLLFWALALIRLLFVRRAGPALRWIAAVALALAVGAIIVRGLEALQPGLSQRLSFAVVFGWVAATSLVLLRRAP
ncbi:DUF998 domain-containing protein [Brevundimonas sp.]|uniref:DUF998 domain-containing protein n=1 Tax=Brevundimonas sp. TaxID=1871086 RepID=UPI0012285ABD|nr:DUF998 domain-containing protein [Brevundimonas sp.]TAJ60681.1 MAG: DUF998 domain-containing protein [Brevundimonas sp.]